MATGSSEQSMSRELLAYLDAEAFVCPKPNVWYELWRTLPERRWIGGGWQPPAPMMLARWHATSDAEKRELFRDHLNWASEHGAFAPFAAAIHALGPQDWHRRPQSRRFVQV